MTAAIQTILTVHLKQRSEIGQIVAKREQTLRRFLKSIEARGEEFISYENTMRWLKETFPNHKEVSVHERYSHIQIFSEWANSFNSRHQILPKKRIGLDKRIPNILSPLDVDIILRELSLFPTRGGFNGTSSSVVTGLMFVTGMRIGEALELQRQHIDWKNSTIYVPIGKSKTDRYIPISVSAKRVLSNYAKKRDRLFPTSKDKFFLFDRGVAISQKPYRDVFRKVCKKDSIVKHLKLDSENNPLRPHDFRHSFAVNSLIKCYNENRDVDEEVSKLTILLGHKSVEETYWYIHAVPSLLNAAFNRGGSL